MRFFLLLLAGALAYAQLCMTYSGSWLGYGIHYVQWGEPAVLYANGSIVSYLPGRGQGVVIGAANSSSQLNVTTCFGLELLTSRLKPADTPWGPAAPVGLAYYGFVDLNGEYLPLPYEGNAVRGCFRLNGLYAVSHKPLGPIEAYSIQLNAYVEASGLYWVQALIRYGDGGFEFLDNVWNMTAPTSTLRGVAGRGAVAYLGRDEYYYYLAQMPRISSACLEIEVAGNAVRFFVNGDLLDEVYLPSPGRIVVLPQVNARGLPIDLELVVGGYSADAPVASVVNGSASLSLYVWNGTAFAPPPALWSIGISTEERAIASAEAAGDGAVVGPGIPEARQLHLRAPCIYFLNGTALCGGVRYLVELELPNGTSYLWAPPGSLSIRLPEILAGDVAYRPTAAVLNLTVAGPTRVEPAYQPFYLISVSTPIGVRRLWAARGELIAATDFTFVDGGVAYVGELLSVNGRLAGELSVEGPANASVLYVAVYNGTARDLLGLPSPLSIAALRCDGRSAYALAGPLGRYNASVYGVEALCSARLYRLPISPYLLVLAALLISKLFRRRKLYKHNTM